VKAIRRAMQAVDSCADKLKRAHQRTDYLERQCVTVGHAETRLRHEESARVLKALDLIHQAQAILNAPIPEMIARELRGES
jgi:hypothetical protein